MSTEPRSSAQCESEGSGLDRKNGLPGASVGVGEGALETGLDEFGDLSTLQADRRG